MDMDSAVLFKNHYGSLYESLLREENEQWKVYKCWEKEYPNEEELKGMRGMVISGSFFNVGDEDPEVQAMV